MKVWSLFFGLFLFPVESLKLVYQPKTEAQVQYQDFLSSRRHSVVIAEGPAGTGKTALAVQQALLSLKEDHSIKKIVMTRPIISSDEGIGFLKGDLNQKMDPWVAPLMDVMKEFYPTSKIKQWMKEGVVEIAPFSFLRGRTFKHCFVIADEVQNATPEQTKLLLTRLGQDSKMVLTGDIEQTDLKRNRRNGLKDLLGRIEGMEVKGIGVIRLANQDVQRHYLLPQILELYR